MYKTNVHKNNIFFLAVLISIIIIAIAFSSLYKNFSEYSYINIISHSLPGIMLLNNNRQIACTDFLYNIGSVKLNINPISYMQFSFSGFNQLSKSNYDACISSERIGLLDIESYSDVPEGEIYFCEEDEYRNEIAEKTGDNIINTVSNSRDDFASNIKAPNKIALSKKNPVVLIYHSHATESYTPYTEGNYHTVDEKKNVISVGSVMTKNLQEKYNYKILHDKTYHDKDSYAYSYANSLTTIKQQTTKNNSLKVFIDIHRDAFTINNNEHKMVKKKEYTVSIKGKKAARVMLVISSANPNYKELEKFAAYIKKKMDKLYPGLYLKTDKKTRSKYNQYLSDYSILIEVGCMLNTIDEAIYTGELMSNIIGEVLNDLQE